MNTNPVGYSTVIAGAVLVVLGLVFFLASNGLLGTQWGTFWPVLPMLVGVGLLTVAVLYEDSVRRPALAAWGATSILLGLFFFAITLQLGITWGDQSTLWGVYPVILGVGLLTGFAASDFRRLGYLASGTLCTTAGFVLLVLARPDVLHPFLPALLLQ